MSIFILAGYNVNQTKWPGKVRELNMGDRDGGHVKIIFDIHVQHHGAHAHYVNVCHVHHIDK